MTMITNLVNDASHFNSVQSVIFQFFREILYSFGIQRLKKTENISMYRHEWGARNASRLENGVEVKFLAQ